MFTGCVIERDGVFHIFYTGHNETFRGTDRPDEAIMHATSPDLVHWTKHPPTRSRSHRLIATNGTTGATHSSIGIPMAANSGCSSPPDARPDRRTGADASRSPRRRTCRTGRSATPCGPRTFTSRMNVPTCSNRGRLVPRVLDVHGADLDPPSAQPEPGGTVARSCRRRVRLTCVLRGQVGVRRTAAFPVRLAAEPDRGAGRRSVAMGRQPCRARDPRRRRLVRRAPTGHSGRQVLDPGRPDRRACHRSVEGRRGHRFGALHGRLRLPPPCVDAGFLLDRGVDRDRARNAVGRRRIAGR